MIDRKPQAIAWLQRVHSELKPDGEFILFLNSMRLRSYTDIMSNSNFQDWLQKIGEYIIDTPAKADLVRNAIIINFVKNKHWYPSSKAIELNFVASAPWTYFDSVRVKPISDSMNGVVALNEKNQLTYDDGSMSLTTKLAIGVPVAALAAWGIWYKLK